MVLDLVVDAKPMAEDVVVKSRNARCRIRVEGNALPMAVDDAVLSKIVRIQLSQKVSVNLMVAVVAAVLNHARKVRKAVDFAARMVVESDVHIRMHMESSAIKEPNALGYVQLIIELKPLWKRRTVAIVSLINLTALVPAFLLLFVYPTSTSL